MEQERKLGGRYRLQNELGRGGMAVVWRALDEVLGRPVAVKVLARGYAGDERFRARILHEARAAATLSHPFIAQIYDFGESDEDGCPVPYVVMELINGPTLQQRVARGPIPPRTVFRICGEIAAALAVAHADGLVHRDIKLANVMVTPAGVKVVDFGIAAVAGPASPEDALLGTPAYLAPERFTGGAIEPASDVYALGVLLYRLLAGVSPWSVETTTQMLTAHVHLEPEPLPRLPGVPETIAALVGRCLAKDPADRPDAAQVSAALGDAAEAATTAPGVRVTGRDPILTAPPAAPQTGTPEPAGTREFAGDAIEAAAGALLVRESTAQAGGPDTARRQAAGAGTAPRPATEAATPPDEAGRSGAVVPRASGATSRRASRVPRKWSKRRKLMAGGGLAAVLAAVPLLWPDAGGEPAAVPGTGSTRKPAASPRVTKAPPAGRGSTRPAAPAADRRRVPESSGSLDPAAVTAPLPSIGAPVPSDAVTSPEPSPSSSAPASAEPSPPEGTRLESPGGTVLARCVDGGSELVAWEPEPGFTVGSVNPGPAWTTAVVFKGERARYRMTVTCFAGRPSAVVLPL